MEELLGKQFEAAKDKGEAELAQAQEEVRQSQETPGFDLASPSGAEQCPEEENQVRRLSNSGPSPKSNSSGLRQGP